MNSLEMGTTRHRKVYLVLLDSIRSGQYRTGDALPSETVLSEQFAVSRVTVRRALQDLANSGVIERKHGLGTFVRSTEVPGVSWYPIRQLRDHVSESGSLAVVVRTLEQVVPPPMVADALGTKADQSVHRAVRVRSRDGRPVLQLTTWVPIEVLPNLSVEALGSMPLYRMFDDVGLSYTRAEQSVSACLADPTTAEDLGVEIGAPLLLIRRVLRSGDVPVEYLELRAPPTLYEVLMAWDVDSDDDAASSASVTYKTRV